jgi:hypothetical protein
MSSSIRRFNSSSRPRTTGNGCVEHQHDLGELYRRPLGDEEALVWAMLDQSLHGEGAQCLAHQRATDGESPCHVLLSQLFAGGEVAGEDEPLQSLDRSLAGDAVLDDHPCRRHVARFLSLIGATAAPARVQLDRTARHA